MLCNTQHATIILGILPVSSSILLSKHLHLHDNEHASVADSQTRTVALEEPMQYGWVHNVVAKPKQKRFEEALLLPAKNSFIGVKVFLTALHDEVTLQIAVE